MSVPAEAIAPSEERRPVLFLSHAGADTEAARKLASQCDIVVESFRPGVMQRLGLDFQTLHGADPRLIYCSISGYGQNGPNSARPAFAQVVQAKSGHDVLQALYQGDPGKLPNTGIYPADVLAGAFPKRETRELPGVVDTSALAGEASR